MQAVLVYRELITERGNPTLDKTPINGEYMLSLIAAELKRNFDANLSIDRVRTESWIFEKVMKFAQQFSRPGKSLENRDKVWNMVKSLEKNGYNKLQQVL